MSEKNRMESTSLVYMCAYYQNKSVIYSLLNTKYLCNVYILLGVMVENILKTLS